MKVVIDDCYFNIWCNNLGDEVRTELDLYPRNL